MEERAIRETRRKDSIQSCSTKGAERKREKLISSRDRRSGEEGGRWSWGKGGREVCTGRGEKRANGLAYDFLQRDHNLGNFAFLRRGIPRSEIERFNWWWIRRFLELRERVNSFSVRFLGAGTDR